MQLSSGVYRIRVTTGGQSYSAAPVVSISGGGGTGASAVAQMNGTKVDAIVIANAGTGYTSNPTVTLANASGDTAGGGAAATAAAIALTTPACFFQGRFGDTYGIDGKSRGFRWDGETPGLEPLGISKPLTAPTIAMSSATGLGYVRSVAIINAGAGYFEPPTIKFSGGGLTDGSPDHATARAKVMNAQVIGMTVDSRGGKYTSVPTVSFSGGIAANATLSVGVSGKLTGAQIGSAGTGYTSSGSQAVTATVSGGGVTGSAGGSERCLPRLRRRRARRRRRCRCGGRRRAVSPPPRRAGPLPRAPSRQGSAPPPPSPHASRSPTLASG